MSPATAKTQRNHLCLWNVNVWVPIQLATPTWTIGYHNTYLQHIKGTPWKGPGPDRGQGQQSKPVLVFNRSRKATQAALEGPLAGNDGMGRAGGPAATGSAVSGVRCEGGGCKSLTWSPDGKEPLVSLVGQGRRRAGVRRPGPPLLEAPGGAAEGLTLATGGHCLIHLLSSKFKKDIQ